MDAPTPIPINPASEIGVSTTLLLPHLSQRPSVSVGSVVFGNLFSKKNDILVVGQLFIKSFAKRVSVE
jgi:hypothetical protein